LPKRRLVVAMQQRFAAAAECMAAAQGAPESAKAVGGVT